MQVQRRVLLPSEVGACQQCDAEGADGAGVGRDDDFAARLARDRGGERVGGKGHALAEDDLADGAVAFYAVEVVLDDGVVEAGDDGCCCGPRQRRPRR